MTPPARAPRHPCQATLNDADQPQDQKNDDDRAEAARRIVTPTGAVRPSGQRAQKQDDQDDDEDQTHRQPLEFIRSERGARRSSSACQSVAVVRSRRWPSECDLTGIKNAPIVTTLSRGGRARA